MIYIFHFRQYQQLSAVEIHSRIISLEIVPIHRFEASLFDFVKKERESEKHVVNSGIKNYKCLSVATLCKTCQIYKRTSWFNEISRVMSDLFPSFSACWFFFLEHD